MYCRLRYLVIVFAAILVCSTAAAKKLKVLIIDGQNNHAAWPKSTIMMKQYLEETGLFKVDINRPKYTWKAEREKEWLGFAGVGNTEDTKAPKADLEFSPNFKKYDVVVSNFGYKAADWPEATQKAFEEYVKNGGGFVVVHAADNSFPKWQEYNKMIGIGGWGGRTEKDGPYVYYTNEGRLVRDSCAGRCGSHGPAHNVPITIRVKDHPITKDVPEKWLTAKDECYALLRGPAENMTILATGKDASGKAPTDRHEPMLMVIDYGKGRVFHTALGHDDYSFEGVGFITTFLRGTEWAATGKVSLPIPKDFPTAEKSSSREFELSMKTIGPAGKILPDLEKFKAPPLSISGWVKGGPVDITDGKKIYVVEFWATWCPPCRKSIPHLTKMQEKYGDLVTIVGVSNMERESGRGVSPEKYKKFLEENISKMGYTVAVESEGKATRDYMRSYGARGIPHAFVINKKGNIIWHGFPGKGLESVLKKVTQEK